METSEKVFHPVYWADEVAIKIYYYMNVQKKTEILTQNLSLIMI